MISVSLEKMGLAPAKSCDGVSTEMIDEWKKQVARLDIMGSLERHLRDYPKPPEAMNFFEGNTYEFRGKNNDTENNPLGLLRPRTQESIHNFFYYSDRHYTQINLSAKSFYDTSLADRINEGLYEATIHEFETVALTALMSLNQPSADKRREMVKKAIDAAFRNKRIITAPLTENPPGWLVYIVLSLLDSHDKRITPLGRCRALELLSIYSVKDLVNGFRNEKHRFYIGYDQMHVPRLPYSFCGREERLMENHGEIWQNNKQIKKLVIGLDKRSIDWRATINAIVSRRPEEAIQIALLLLHNTDAAEGTLAMLMQIPRLDEQTRSRMFGKSATFLIEHKLTLVGDIQSLAMEGTGIIENPADSENLEGLSADELIQIVRREKVRSANLEDDIVSEQTKAAKLEWERVQIEADRKRLQAEIEYWRTGAASQGIPNPSSRPTIDPVEQMDPEGYYRILGLYPEFIEGKEPKWVEATIKTHYRAASMADHPDKGGDNEYMIKVNAAYEVLKDPEKRKRYGN